MLVLAVACGSAHDEKAAAAPPTVLAFPRGEGPKIGAGSIAQATLALLHDQRSALKMRAPIEELTVFETESDELWMTHVQLAQTERGVPVIGGGLSAHYDSDGRLTSVVGKYVPGLEQIEVVPELDADAARKAALDDRIDGSEARADLEVAGQPRLVINAADEPRLAWEIGVQKTHGIGQWLVSVDALSGAVFGRLTELRSVAGSGVSVSGTRRNLECTSFPDRGLYGLRDERRSTTISTLDARNGTDVSSIGLVGSTSPTSWDTNSVAPGAAVDVHINAGIVIDFYWNALGRKGMDDRSLAVENVVHYGNNLENAFYDAKTNKMHYGDGGQSFYTFAGSLDIAAHEMTHGVTHFLSALRYENQSGALDESIADIFAAMVEHSIKPDPVKNWLFSEGLLRNGGAVRDMANPKVSHMSEYETTREDNGGVHANSGIPSKAAHLMTMGGTHPVSGVTVGNPLGFEKAARVWYRTNQQYLTQTSDFAAAAVGTKAAAADLKLSPADISTIDCAWKAVGVLPGTCGDANSTNTNQLAPQNGGTSGAPDPNGPAYVIEIKGNSGCSTTSQASSASPLAILVGLALLRRRKRCS
jgi:thermolysin